MFCKRCRYNLKMISSRSCPECGRAFDAGDPKTYRRNVGWPKWVRRCFQWLLAFFVVVLIALGVIEVRYQREVAAVQVLEHVGAELGVGYSDDAIEWVQNIPFLYERLQRLIFVSLNSNQPISLPPEIGKLTSLTSLYLNDSVTLHFRDDDENIQPTTLPPEIVNLTKLMHLTVRNNGLSALPPEIGMLTQLENLSLGDNQLTTLPREIGKLTKLTALHIFNNQLTVLPPEIGRLSKLTDLALGVNPITDADLEHLKSLSNLKKLTIKGTKVTSQGVEALRLALPNCRIESDFD